MQRVTPERRWPLHDIAATRGLERAAAAGLPPHTLMQRAGLATSRLALAIAPHARHIWVACGPGNNGGDGVEAAMHLAAWGRTVTLSFCGSAERLPADAAAAHARARAAGLHTTPEPPEHWDLAIDALLGIGARLPLTGVPAQWAAALSGGGAPVLAVDVPSGLDADTGAQVAVRASHTLSLLTLKPGLFTAHGRDASGELWFDDLGVAGAQPCTAWLNGPPPHRLRAHASHKGSFGDVAVIGGAQGMQGAALLAASAALHAGAGRVYAGLLDGSGPRWDGAQPELMLRDWKGLDLTRMAVACGCGGGHAVADALPVVLQSAQRLVLDADALNAVAGTPRLRAMVAERTARSPGSTVLTPHPLEAARLLGCDTAQVQADRLHAAQALAEQLGATVLLKGSGTVIASPAELPVINPTGNARLATAGTGDVLAGMVAARLAGGEDGFQSACAAAFLHGARADAWPDGTRLTAGALARAL